MVAQGSLSVSSCSKESFFTGQTSAEGFLNEGGQLTIIGLDVISFDAFAAGGAIQTEANSLIRARGSSAVIILEPVDQNSGTAMFVTSSNINVSGSDNSDW